MTKLKKSVSFPKYMFMGAILMLSFVTFLMIKSYLDDKEEYSYITNPQVGDIYLLVYYEAHSEYKYYLWKAEKLFADSLYISANAYSYNMIATELIDGDGFYNSGSTVILMEIQSKGWKIEVRSRKKIFPKWLNVTVPYSCIGVFTFFTSVSGLPTSDPLYYLSLNSGQNHNSYYVIDKKDLLDLYEKGELVKVRREYASGSGFDRILIEDEESLQSAIN